MFNFDENHSQQCVIKKKWCISLSIFLLESLKVNTKTNMIPIKFITISTYFSYNADG
jgi:hypothetical protein